MLADNTLRLIVPDLLYAGLALLMLSVCAFVVARTSRVLYVAAIGFFIAAVPKILIGGLDLLVWFGFANHDTYAPDLVVRLANLQAYALLLASISVVWSTSQLVRRRT